MIAPPRGRARLLLPNGREGAVPFANQTGFPEPVPQPRGSPNLMSNMWMCSVR